MLLIRHPANGPVLQQLLAFHQVENAVGKSADWDSPQLFMYFPVNERAFLDLVQSLFKTQEKIVAKALSFLLIEFEMRADIQLRVLSECEPISRDSVETIFDVSEF
jgi:hypothetical protein